MTLSRRLRVLHAPKLPPCPRAAFLAGFLLKNAMLDAAFLLTVGSFLLTVELFYLQLTILAFLLTVGAFLLTVLPSLLTIGESASNKGLKGL